MPPYRIKVYCLDCPWHRQGWSVQTMVKADKHMQKTGHALEAWRLNGNTPASFLISINPPRPESW